MDRTETLSQFIKIRKIPMCASIWSCSPDSDGSLCLFCSILLSQPLLASVVWMSIMAYYQRTLTSFCEQGTRISGSNGGGKGEHNSKTIMQFILKVVATVPS